MTAIPDQLIRVSSAKLGNQKGKSRLYLQGKYLSKAGFKPATKLKMEIEKLIDSKILSKII